MSPATTNPDTAETPEPVLLILADISGYTRYMTANAKTLAHSQSIITELVKGIVKQAELPLEVAKLEGDAVFLYCRKQQTAGSWPETKRILGEKLLGFFRIFSEKVLELSQSTTCSCNACMHIERLRLKIIVHSGEALFHQVLHFVELAGVDVIIAHRLLKNSIPADQYLLMTEAAHQDVEFPDRISLRPGVESYEDIGQLKTLVYFPDSARPTSGLAENKPASNRFANTWRMSTRLMIASLTNATSHRHFRNVTTDATRFGRAAFALLNLFLVPILLPVTAIFALVHSMKKPTAAPGGADHQDHVHKPDGSCCDPRLKAD